MESNPEEHLIFPLLSGRNRKLCENAIRKLQTYGIVADFEGMDDPEAAELYAWSERNITVLEAYFRFAGLGVRAQHGFPVIQLVLEDDAQSHPLRRRLNKSETGLLICLWVLYHERMKEVGGFLVTVTVAEIYARLSALYSTDKEIPETVFQDCIRLFERYYLLQTDWLFDDFSHSRLGLLPTLLTTFHFLDVEEARKWSAIPEVANDSDSRS